MAGPRLLVADGNDPPGRTRLVESTGVTASEGYAAVLRRLTPDATVEICYPADPDPLLPGALESYDGVAVTGSWLNIHRREPQSMRQVDFARSVFAAGVPMFGSCWGLQLATVAAGGDVAANPRGREVAFAREVTLTEAGRSHSMHRGRTIVFDAPAIHADEVATLAPGMTVTAANAMSPVQAAEICVGRCVFWGVQYHPEYTLGEVAAVVRRYGRTLVDEGFFVSVEDLESYARDLSALDADATRRDVAWRLNIGRDLLVADERVREIANWLAFQVRGAR